MCTEMMTLLGEARQSFKDDGGDEAFTAWLGTVVEPLGADPQRGLILPVAAIVGLLDLSRDKWPDALSDAMLEGLIRQAEA